MASVDNSRMSEYLVEGPSPGSYDSRASQYLIEGTDKAVFVSRTSQYLILSPSNNPSQPILGSF